MNARGFGVLLGALAAAGAVGSGCSGTSDAGAGPGGDASVGASGGTAGGGGSGGSGLSGSGGGVGLDVHLSDAPPDGLTCPDGGVPGDPGCACGKLEFTIDTQQSCAISILPGFSVDGEGFISVGGQNHRVFAMDR